ncbi:hypothetical protein DFH06DRAFT_301798 [Mycena polygramma]|nr:hypothetical protein DFH06DRAFT_301798 [Mycena polygramma]
MAIDASPLTGYYRATDILYHYHQSLKNTRDAVQLQKILSYDAVLHPRHPFAAEGAKGIQGYIGTFHDGQARVLFSSAQVDYLRYWMHAMKLTENMIPLPYSDCMFLESSVATASSTVFESLSVLGSTSKKLGRMNQAFKEKPLLVARRAAFERVRTLWNAKEGVWCALNFAAWEVDHTALSDFGWSLIRWESGTEISERGHLVVKENQTYKKTQLEDGAEHEMVTKATLKRKVNDLFSRLGQHGPIFLVSNDSKGDLKYLQSNAFQVPLADSVLELPETVPSGGVFIVEPAELFDALTGSGDADSRPQLGAHVQAPENQLQGCSQRGYRRGVHLASSAHHGLGTAAWTIKREQRWPDQTEVEVQFQPWNDDPKHADPPGRLPTSGRRPVFALASIPFPVFLPANCIHPSRADFLGI